jgi:hypothetical protein
MEKTKFFKAMQRIAITVLVAIIGFSFATCGDPEQGPTGQQGPAGPQGNTGPAGSVKVVDSEGREVGTFIMSGSIEDSSALSSSPPRMVDILYVAKNGYTFPIRRIQDVGYTAIEHVPLYFTEQNFAGKLYFSVSVSKDAPFLKNFIAKSGSGYYRAKNRDAQGYAIRGRETVSFKSCGRGPGGGGGWPTHSGTLVNAIEVEIVTEVTDESLIGFTPSHPVRLQY